MVIFDLTKFANCDDLEIVLLWRSLIFKCIIISEYRRENETDYNESTDKSFFFRLSLFLMHAQQVFYPKILMERWKHGILFDETHLNFDLNIILVYNNLAKDKLA